MKPDRLNAFTDGVVAIVITIMVLSLPVPKSGDLAALRPDITLFGAYALSFVNVGIYWNNHHHMMQTARQVDGRVLWANLFLLFWLSLFPFLIRWIGEVGVTALPVAAFGVILLLAGLAYYLLERALIAAEGEDSKIARAVGSKTKEWISVALYAAAIALAFVSPWLSVAIYFVVAGLWLVPDRRFEHVREGNP
ncbi:MAG TPA: TMEM175 family protein [Sphingomicrobium sp.]|nr:TMEM175 family protein [Sphingomicrobium sp.]